MIKKIIYTLKTVLLAFVLWILTSATYENISIKIEVRKFMEKGVYSEELSSTYRKLYIVPRETWQEKLPAYSLKNGQIYPGTTGDILVALESPFDNMPIIDELITFFVGGHAAICTSEYEDYQLLIKSTDVIDIAGLNDNPEDNKVENDNKLYWMDNEYKNSFIGLRINSTEEQRKIVFNKAVSLIGEPYNYSFVFNTKNSHYCTDIMTKAWSSVGINLNKDKVITSVLDLIVNSNTYIFMYKYTDNNLVDHIYFIDSN